MPVISLWRRTISWIWETNSGEGGWPSRGSMVSLAALTPAHRMKQATAAPHHPSMFTFQKWPARVLSSTAVVARESLRLSAAVAAMAAEPIFQPMARL